MTLRTMKQYMVSVVALAIVFISAAAASQNDFSKSNGMTRRGSYGKHHAAKWASEHSSHSPHSSHGSENDHYLVVETEQGKVRGSVNSSSNVYSWLGVPFGADTGGNSRFLAPKPAPHWDGVKNATHYGHACPQHASGQSVAAAALFGLPSSIFDDDIQSEDCLNMNIWVNKKHWEKFRDSGGKSSKAPVWINIYGGSFEWGSNRIGAYPGFEVSGEDNVISVSINFRNWIFGYPLAPQQHPDRNHNKESYTGANPGLKDVDLAIKWVYNNIEKFGGDKNRITIGGTSTGACAADNWAYSHYKKESSKYVKGIILQSGSMTSLGRFFVQDKKYNWAQPKSPWSMVAKEVGCGTDANEEQFKCMQKKPWKSLIKASFKTDAKFYLGIDHVTVFDDYDKRLERRQYVDTPMLVGNNKDEGNAFLIHNAYLTDFLGPIITSEVWVCPTSMQAKERVGYAPTWRYRFSPSFYIPGAPKEYRELLSYHGSDTAYAWGTWKYFHFVDSPELHGDKGPVVYIPKATDDPKVIAPIAKMYRKANTEFVKDPENGLYDFYGGWPTYKPLTKSIGDIGYQNSPNFRLASSLEVDGMCPIANKGVINNSIKYKAGFPKIRGYLI